MSLQVQSAPPKRLIKVLPSVGTHRRAFCPLVAGGRLQNLVYELPRTLPKSEFCKPMFAYLLAAVGVGCEYSRKRPKRPEAAICPHHATLPTSPTKKSGPSSNRCSAGSKGAVDRPSGLHAGSRTPFSTCSEERLLVAHAPTRVPTLADGVLPFFSAGGGSTAGSEERMTGCAKRCAKRRDATGTLALR
jgi:hypothetical protein